jgi:carbamoyl-phosphate synthase large subunit
MLTEQTQFPATLPSGRPVTVAVTGLNATDNPGPGVGVLRSLRAAGADYRLVGLAYDALDPGVYAKELADAVFMIPYPSQGLDPFLARIEYIHARTPIDVIIPTLDAELPSFIRTRNQLSKMGIHFVLPTQEQLDMRAKTRLGELGRLSGLPVPEEAVVGSAAEMAGIHHKVPYPFFVKGPYYGATLAKSVDQAIAAYHKAIATWGPPIVVQQFVDGEEYNVIAVGDGTGGLLGAVPMKKMALTDKGKGWAGITIKAPGLVGLAAQFMKATHWAGGCELEVIRDKQDTPYVIEVNPRFPAWVHLSTAAGVNMPHLVTQFALGNHVSSHTEYKVGTMFVRISLDQIVEFANFQQFVVSGELAEQGQTFAAAEVA